MCRIPNTLIHPALATRHRDARLCPQPIQRNENLPSVTAADAIGHDVDPVAGVTQVEGGLGDADVGLYSDEGDVGLWGEGGGDGGNVHGESGLVVGWRWEEGVDGGDGSTKFGGGLGCAVDGKGEGVGEGEELLGCEDAVRGG